VKATPENCFHLTVDIVREIHAAAIAGFGGADGVTDVALLESAVAAPQAVRGGRAPYRDMAEVAGRIFFISAKTTPSSMATSAPRSAPASYFCA